MSNFIQNAALEQFAIELSENRPSAGHFVAVRCPFSKIRVDQEESQTKRDGRTDDGGAARGRERAPGGGDFVTCPFYHFRHGEICN